MMHKNNLAFIEKLGAFALQSKAVKHPYLRALSDGDLPNMEQAFTDFAYQYGEYSRHFTLYLTTLIEQLESNSHKQILLENLREEQGNAHDADLPEDILIYVENKAHSDLFKQFQLAMGVNESYRQPLAPVSQLWSKQFLSLCSTNACVGIGALGFGTELLVFDIYKQILQGLKNHTSLSMQERVFFDLHSQCDEEHAAQMQKIACELATDQISCEQLEFGMNMAINMRSMFWDKMLERALKMPDSKKFAFAKPNTQSISESATNCV